MYDLGALCVDYCRTEDDIDDFVSLYGGASESRGARTRLYMILEDFIWGCWGKVMHFRTQRRNEIEFHKYGENRLQRSEFYLTHWDIDALVRKI